MVVFKAGSNNNDLFAAVLTDWPLQTIVAATVRQSLDELRLRQIVGVVQRRAVGFGAV